MKFVEQIFLVILILNGSVLRRVDATVNKYSSLVTDVHKYYATSSVFFLFTGEDRRLQEYTLIHSLCRDFSRKGVLTLTIRFDNLEGRTNFYRRNIVRPLIVVVFKSVSDIAGFRASTRTMKKSYPIWLVVFAGELDQQLCEYCSRPSGNILGLQFNTEMLVKCCNDRVLREWWSERVDRTEMADFATWNQKDGFALTGKGALYARRHNINGTGIRVALVTKSALIHDKGHYVDGFFGNILTELNHAMNFKITKTIREDVFGSLNSATKNWSGVIGQLARREADLGVSEFVMTKARLDVVDFSLPLLISRSKLYIREPGASRLDWAAYFKVFTFETWSGIIILLITTPILLTMIKMKKNSIALTCIISENYLHVWGIFCQQGLCESSAGVPLRIAYFAIFLTASVVSAAYSAALISFLTVRTVHLPFSTMDDFAKDGSYKLIVHRNSADYDLFVNSNDQVLSKMMTMMKPWENLPQTLEEGFEQVCSENVAFYTNEVVKKTIDLSIKCQVAGIDTERTVTLAMTLPAGSQYTGLLRYHIHRFRDNGMIDRLKQKYFVRSDLAENKYHIVSIRGTAPILSILAGGMIFAFLVFFLEKLYHCPSNCAPQRSRWSHKSQLHKWCYSKSEYEKRPFTTSNSFD